MFKKKFYYYIKVFGCQMNRADAEIIAAILSKKNGNLADDCSGADLIVAVTCGVRSSAEERAISWIKKTRSQNRKAVIVLTGCLSHRKDIKKRLDDTVNYFVPIDKWAESISFVIPEKSGIQDNKDKMVISTFYKTTPRRASTFQAYLPIMTGCNNFCSYCVVPYARGREQSRPPEDILKEAKKLIKSGYKELYLLGQNVNSYQGRDRSRQIWSFSRLVRQLDKIPGKFWIRFISSHPKDITDDFLAALKACSKVSPNLHLPIQSGSNKILRLMNRKYTREEYLNLIKKIRRIYPRVVLSTDIIVGFPGETEKDFQDSLDVVKKVGFEMLFSLKYSPRPETAAFRLKDSVSALTKIDRQRKLDQTWKKIALEKNKRFINQKITVLVDRTKTKVDSSGKNKRYLLGKSFDNKDVRIEIKNSVGTDLIGKWISALIKDVTPLALMG